MKTILTTIFSVFLFTSAAAVVQAQVLINEVLPNPTTSGDTSEWVELFNYSQQSVDVGGWFLDSAQFPDGTIIAPQGFLIVTKSAAAFSAEFGTITPLQLNISLSNSGDTVVLTQNSTTIDSFTYTASTEAESWQRAGAECADLAVGSPHTLAAPNDNYDPECFDLTSIPPSPPPITTFPELQITEVMPNPEGSDSGQEWIEIFNPTAQTISLTGVEVHDSQGKLLTFTAQDVINPGQYAVVSLSGLPLLNCAQGSGCSESVILKLGSFVIDQMTYQVAKSGQSWSWDPVRGAWADDMQVTPGLANAPRPVVTPPPAKGSSDEVEVVTDPDPQGIPTGNNSVVIPPPPPPNPHKLPDLRIHYLPKDELPTMQIWSLFIPAREMSLIVASMLTIALLYRHGWIEQYVSWWLRH